MSFDHPQGLWLLALGIPILAFHFYKGRIRQMSVPLLLFWEQVLVQEERKTALKKLRYWASLFISLLALALLTSAVAGPNVKGFTRPKTRFAILLDNSPSMAAAEPDGRTRADHAVDLARAFIGTLAAGDRVSILDLSGARSPFSEDHDAVSRRLRVPQPGPKVELRSLVLEARAEGEDVIAVLFTDHPARGVDDLLADGRLRMQRVGTPRENSGWIAGRAWRRPGEKMLKLTLTAQNFSAATRKRDALLTSNRHLLEKRSLELEPGVPVETEWVLDPAKYPGSRLEEGALIEVSFEPPDAFPADDDACFVLPPLLPPPVIVFHPGKPSELLMHALETLQTGGLIAQDMSEAPISRFPGLRSTLGEGWIMIFDRVAPPNLPERGTSLVLGAPGDGMVEKPTLVDWDRDAPPNQRVDYGGLLLRKSRILKGTPLLSAIEGPVAVWSSRGGRATVELGFPLEESDIAARPAFLLMLINLVEWGPARALRSFPYEVRMGEALRPLRRLWMESGELGFRYADHVERVDVTAGRPRTALSFGPGFVRASAANRTEWIAVNLFDAEESDLREPPEAPLGVALPPPAPWHAKVPYAVLAISAVLALFVLEWLLYQRGWV